MMQFKADNPILYNATLILSSLLMLICLLAFLKHFLKRWWRRTNGCSGNCVEEICVDGCIDNFMHLCTDTRTFGTVISTQSSSRNTRQQHRSRRNRILNQSEDLSLEEISASNDGRSTVNLGHLTADENADIGDREAVVMSEQPPQYEELSDLANRGSPDLPTYAEYIDEPEKYS